MWLLGKRTISGAAAQDTLLVAMLIALVLNVSGCRHDVIDTLHAPLQIVALEGSGLRLENNTVVELRRSECLTVELAKELFPEGLEISEGATPIGLLHIRHFCGNDRIVNHLERVDAIEFLEFYCRQLAQGGDAWWQYRDGNALEIRSSVFMDFTVQVGRPWNGVGNWPMWNR